MDRTPSFIIQSICSKEKEKNKHLFLIHNAGGHERFVNKKPPDQRSDSLNTSRILFKHFKHLFNILVSSARKVHDENLIQAHRRC